MLKNFQLYVFRELFLYLFCYLNHDGTFHTFAEELTAVFIYACNIPCCMVSVGSAAAGTVQFCPAAFAVRTCISIAFAEFVLHFRMGNAFPDITQTISRIAYELMAREQFAPKGVTAIYSVPLPQPVTRLYTQGPPVKSIM